MMPDKSDHHPPATQPVPIGDFPGGRPGFRQDLCKNKPFTLITAPMRKYSSVRIHNCCITLKEAFVINGHPRHRAREYTDKIRQLHINLT
jgi:hypothetical protein